MGMNGYLQKSGKRTRMRVTRFFELEGTVLSSHRAEKMDATWTIDISDSILTGSNPQLEINIEIPDMKSITLYADSSESFAKWMQALENAVARKFELYYESGAFLGQGSISIVKLATNTISGERFAAKFIDKRRSGDRFGDDELKSLRGINHPQIVRTYDVFESNEQFVVLMEHMNKGLLYDLLSSQLPSEKTISKCVQQILEAVQYLHKNGMVHRNLKPENVFADGEYQPYLVKVSDCGIRNWYRVEEDGQDPEVIPIGDEAYIAPEVLAQKGFSPQMDAWSVGMLAYHMLVGRSPYPTGQRQPIDFSASELRTVSELGISFLRGLLETEEKKRLSVGNALEHAWIVEGDRLSSRPVGNKLHSLSSSQRKVTKKLTIRNEREKGTSYQTTGSYQRNTPDVLVYGSRSVTDPGSYSVNRDPWGGKATASQSKGLLRSSRSIISKTSLGGGNFRGGDGASSFLNRETSGRSSRGLFRSISGGKRS